MLGAAHPFVYDYPNGLLTEIGTVGNWANAWAINNNNQVVGTVNAGDWMTQDLSGYLFDYNSKTLIDLDTILGIDTDGSYGINDKGQMLVCSYDANNVHHPLLVTPAEDSSNVPEPATMVLLGTGLVAVVNFRKRD